MGERIGRTKIRLLKAPSNLTLNVSRDGASTTSLGNLFQCFTTLIFKTITPCPIATGPAKKSLSIFLRSPLYMLKGCNKVSLEPSLLQAEQPQLSQPFHIGEVFQPSDHFCGPPLDPLQQVHVFPVLRAPELDAVLQVRSHQSRVEWQNHLPQPAGHASFDAAQDTVGLLGCEHTLPAHVQLFVHQYPQVLFRRAALNHIIPQPVLKLRIAPTQDPALGLVEPHEVHTGPLLQIVQVPLDDIPSFWRVNCTTQLGVICRLAEGALDLAVYVTDENIEQHWSQYGPLRDTTPVDFHPLDFTIQPIPYPLNGPPIKFVSLQFRVKDVVGDYGWRLNHFPGQSVPMLDNPLGEEKFPNIQSKPPLAQLEAISSCPITCYLGEETDPHLSTTSFQVVVESDEVSPQPPFLQAKQSQLPQPLLIRLLLQTLHQLRCPSLYALQYLNIPLVVGGPKLNTVFEVRPHQCRVQGHNHFPSPAGHAIFDAGQDAIGLLGRLGTLLAHIQAAVNQHPQVLLCQAAFQPLFPKPVALHGVAVAQVQDLALGLVEPHTIDLGPSIQPVQVPLQSLPTLQQINTPTQLGVVCKLTESALDPFVQIIDKDVKQNWPQHRALGNTACDRPPTGVNSIHHHSLGPAVQPVLYPAKSTPVQAMSSQFLQENAVGNRVKGFTEV
ncbi:LOW QUALITY PROTEIN: hypothetical protein QYF61_015717 [Mycteria americana]|uniref:Uncharacterized protein n=1 Tax=Mycteria americana TaxID=33587 RepID=A0AAN7NHQ4_MYCAM|nr:LOW QUALITY PROTEIN: hypothetical protein QYF61_015717 [Mycteria americana]